MERSRNNDRLVVCVCNGDYPVDLEVRKIYRALPDPAAASDGFVRVIDESGEDYLYPTAFYCPIVLPVGVRRALRFGQPARPERNARRLRPAKRSRAAG